MEQEGRRCLPIAGDIGDEAFCRAAVDQTVRDLGRLDILVNNAAEQHPQDSITDITRRATGAHVPHQHLRHVLHDQSGAAAPA